MVLYLCMCSTWEATLRANLPVKVCVVAIPACAGAPWDQHGISTPPFLPAPESQPPRKPYARASSLKPPYPHESRPAQLRAASAPAACVRGQGWWGRGEARGGRAGVCGKGAHLA